MIDHFFTQMFGQTIYGNETIAGLGFIVVKHASGNTDYVREVADTNNVVLTPSGRGYAYFCKDGGKRIISFDSKSKELYQLRIRDLSPARREELGFTSANYEISAERFQEIEEGIKNTDEDLERSIDDWKEEDHLRLLTS